MKVSTSSEFDLDLFFFVYINYHFVCLFVCSDLPRYANEFSVEIHTLRRKSFVGRENLLG